MDFLKQSFSWRTFSPKFFASLSSLWIVLKPIHELLKLEAGWFEYLGLLFLSIIVTIIWNWPRSIIKHRFNHNDLTVRIIKGDILNAETNIVIGFSDTFDTEIGRIIKTKSLQGQFQQQVFNGDVAELNEQLDRLLLPEQKYAISDPDKTVGKQQRFPIGTTLTLDYGKRYFFLTYTMMGNDLACIPTSAENIVLALFKLWDCTGRNAQNDSIAVPVIATDAARSGLSRTTIIKLIVLTFYAAHSTKTVAKGLDIYVHPKDIEHVDFNSVKAFLTGL